MKKNYNIVEAISYTSDNGVFWQLIDQDNAVVEDGFESTADAIDWALANNYVSPQHEYDSYVDECNEVNKHPMPYSEFTSKLSSGELHLI